MTSVPLSSMVRLSMARSTGFRLGGLSGDEAELGCSVKRAAVGAVEAECIRG